MTSDKLIELRCQSVFSSYLSEFVAQKRALGCKYNTGVESLNLFDSYCASHGVTKAFMTEELYNAWVTRRASENESTHQTRVTYARQFAAFLYNNGAGEIAAFHPLPKKTNAFVPYIFTEEQISRFMKTVDEQNNQPIPGTPVRHLVYPVLFRTLYGCGLRANEAVKIRTADVDMGSGAIVIRMAKGGKDRMVVMSDSLLKVCRAYRANDKILNYESEYFFPTRDHGYYDTSTIYADFRKYLFLSGIPHGGRGKGPRLHDFRHSFAVHVLNNWAKQGKDLYTCLPVLQRYLGHSNITATEKYLQLIPEAYCQVTNAFNSKFTDIFPEAVNEEK